MDVFTKIICTIGPAVMGLERMKELMLSGMDVARINFSHGTQEDHLQTIANLKKAREELGRPLAIMLDTKGAEIRIKKLFGSNLEVKAGQKLFFKPKIEAENDLVIEPFSVLAGILPKTRILIDDGYITTEVEEVTKDFVAVVVKNPGVIKLNKGVNIPGANSKLPILTQKDRDDIIFGCQHDIDLIAASFIRTAEGVLTIKNLLFEQGKPDILVIAKIESKEGLENFESIVEVADGIMVARGDLGVEIDVSQVPKFQKMMIAKSALSCKPVVIATQMLESMINNPRPTRAEVSDVANAIYDGATAVMLSAETAVGSYPMETVKRMHSIIKESESDIDYFAFFQKQDKSKFSDISSSMAIAAVKTAYSSLAEAIFVYTTSGYTARLVSAWHPPKLILALTDSLKTYHQLAFAWGVLPVYTKKCRDAEEAFKIMSEYALKNNIVPFGGLVVVTAGVPFGKKGSTNLMMLDSVGRILVRGQGYGEAVEGEIFVVRSLEKSPELLSKDKILVIPRCSEEYFPLLEGAKGLILENMLGDTKSEKTVVALAEKLKVPLLIHAENAMTLLSSGQKVVLDARRGLVYAG
ncbi:MAG: pyruvate kinase [Parachlamydiales bacterium]|jgi:pyruvate kinase